MRSLNANRSKSISFQGEQATGNWQPATGNESSIWSLTRDRQLRVCRPDLTIAGRLLPVACCLFDGTRHGRSDQLRNHASITAQPIEMIELSLSAMGSKWIGF